MTRFHQAFSLALEGRFDALWPDLEPDERTLGALAVYRNTATRGRIDALEANYPTVAQLVGRDWFRAAAREFVEAHPGSDPVLAGFGATFPDWLAAFEPAREMPFLAPSARLDRAWTEAHLATDDAVLEVEDAAASGLALTVRAARLHPSVRLFWFDWSAPSLWLAHRYPELDTRLDWRPEPQGLLIHRPRGDVQARHVSRAEWVFLDACRKSRAFGVAALAASATRPSPHIPTLFSRLLRDGVFCTPSRQDQTR